ncbi:GxxExxY protein [Candidatus Parcubacteria bacterium]|nr:MAG: GxxExxY protein [Candidatus Parcubacteria bacterium]
MGRWTALTDQIIGGFYSVYNELGFGFAEKVYERALLIALSQMGLDVQNQVPIPVYFRGQQIGDFYADLVVENIMVLELKATKAIAPEHEAQLISYLKSTRYEIGLLLNFGPKPQIKRKIFDNARKGSLSWLAPKPPQNHT